MWSTIAHAHARVCFLFVVGLLGVAQAGAVQKRFGVPVAAEDACNPSLGNATFAADASDCQLFYMCVHGWPQLSFCPADTILSQTSAHVGRCETAVRACQRHVCGHVPPRPPTWTANTCSAVIEEGYSQCDFHCVASPECIAWHARCDGIRHCRDGSDEINCASPCDPQVCRLPHCRCAGADIPGGLLAREVPQLVLMTWESAVRLEDYNHLLQQILKRVGRNRRREPRRNPNGCPITATFFMEHQFTNYAAVQDLYAAGNEIALLSISKTAQTEYWKNAPQETWTREFADQRTIVSSLANVKPVDVVGMRAPFLQVGGDDQFAMLYDNNFLYDNSMPTPNIEPPTWPYTLEYRSTQPCVVPPCPTQSFPGVWEVPLVDWLDTNDTLCATVDNCFMPRDGAESLDLLRSNFARHYHGNRAPFPLHLRARWFIEGHYNIEALETFLDELATMSDVYVVTMSAAVAWVRQPTPLRRLAASRLLSCDQRSEPTCRRPITCAYYNVTHAPNSVDHPGDRYMETCATICPPRYPWVGNPLGARQ
ncbi:PREDICTED: uncharacterized protein LOC106807305 [Priapulus caudatus]|uniref:Uncharacterized protein LOC106807305 n=1 Tax=Priapulus caudatus TaxID=37621 RepID=A0ABM1DYS7_PRICU|nr:PREDICTED: uncharacterized protein LOC106807305 [Priapulus caudatus]